MSDNKVVKSQVDESKNKLLRKASKKGDVYGVKGCIEFEALKDGVFIHADVNSRSKNGKTALYLASANGHVEIVYFLLKNGADPNICDDDNNSPLMVAERKKYSEISALLLLNGAEPRLSNFNNGMADICLNENLQRLFTLLLNDSYRKINELGREASYLSTKEKPKDFEKKREIMDKIKTNKELKHKLEEIYFRNENKPHKRIKTEIKEEH